LPARWSRFLQNLFPLWVLIGGALGYLFPQELKPLGNKIPLMLGVVMLGMGVTIPFEQWRGLTRSTRALVVGISLQYLVMPLLAFLLSLIFRLSPELSLGMILVGAAPGGTASNVITYLARADLPLSIAMTTATTLLSPIFTPLWVYILAGHWIPVNPIPLFFSVLEIVLIPVLLGVAIRSLFPPPGWVNEHLLPLLSMGVIAFIVAVIVAINRLELSTLLTLLLPVLFHHILGLTLGYTLPRLGKVSPLKARTIAFEIGIQNSGLSVALATKHFQPVSALPGALFSVIQNLVGPLLALYFRAHPPSQEPSPPSWETFR
jgi:BASS family bile acid:Na+ symporter